MPQTITEQLSREQQIAALEKDWATNPRWKGVKRGYSAADVVRLRARKSMGGGKGFVDGGFELREEVCWG